jgi:hypothetical protein
MIDDDDDDDDSGSWMWKGDNLGGLVKAGKGKERVLKGEEDQRVIR